MINESEFTGNERFSVRRRLGVGGMGVVYEAFDSERNAEVALKTLKWSDPQALYRFKQEFRSLVDISHPNLVTLHELVRAGELWMLTMELVRGRSFLDHVRGLMVSGPAAKRDHAQLSSGYRDAQGEASPPPDLQRLEDALRQLCLGVRALHDAGKLHRDIKPSNVLVERDGRVVLLDFGLITDLTRQATHPRTTGDVVVGTAAYMAPEQAASRPLSAASDWYSVGAMLYEALTGVLPYHGTPLEILMDKQHLDPIPPRALLPSLPPHLSDLCLALLHRDAEQRPTADQILSALGGTSPRHAYQSFTTRSHAIRFFGRKQELSALCESLETTRTGRPALALVHGASGMGKSALLSQFADVAMAEYHAQVLIGRCYESESVPFKAMDSLIDSLASRLAAMPRGQAEAIVPRDRFSLSRLFPVLKRVDAIAEAPLQTAFPDIRELRSRAGAALGELLGRYAARQPLVLAIDDLQWGDLDSASLLVDLLSANDAPPALFILTYRTAARLSSAALEHFFSSLAARGGTLPVIEIEIGALSDEEASSCALSQLASNATADVALAHAIAKESGGSPFFIAELVRYARSGLMPASAAAGVAAATPSLPSISLDDAIRARLAALDPSSRMVLELIAVAGRPISKHAVYRAAGLEENDAAIFVLRAGRVILASGGKSAHDVETANDRLRAAVVDALAPTALASHHAALASALEREEGVDPEILAAHHRGAGQLQRAGELSAKAAERAFEALAFERAAALLRVALAELPESYPQRNALLERLGDAELGAGRSKAAATAYLEAASDAAPARALELRRRAAEQFFRSAQFQEGLAAVASVLEKVSLSLSPTPRRALATLLMRRLRVRLRGLRFEPRDESEIAETALRRIDTCWSIASSVGPIDTIIGASLQTQHLILALEAGERARIGRALAVECFYSALSAHRTERRTRRLVEYASRLATEIKHPHTTAIAKMAACMCEYQLGHWRLALDHAKAAMEIFETECTSVYFEIASGRRWIIDCLFNLGLLSELARRGTLWLNDAKRRGDAHLETEMRTGLASTVWLMRDETELLREQARASVALWPSNRYLLQHYTTDLALAHAELYDGNGRAAYQIVCDAWKPLKRSLLLRICALEVEALFLRGRCAVAAAIEGEAGALADARRCAKKLARKRVPGGPGMAQLLRGLIAESSGALELAATAYRGALEKLSGAGLQLLAESARLRLGTLLGGDEGPPLREAALAWFQSHAVVHPLHFARVFVPARTLS